MSSEEHDQEHISSAALKESQALLHPDVDKALAHESHDTVPTAANWEKSYGTINAVNSPVTAFTEVPKQCIAATTVIAANNLAIRIAQTLWGIFRGWDDKQGRSQWTQDLVRDAFQENPQFNYVIVHTNHTTNFEGVRDQDWSARTYDYSLRIGRIRYTLYAFRSGTFSLHGDGGYLNWAYNGHVVSADRDSRRPRTVVFRAA